MFSRPLSPSYGFDEDSLSPKIRALKCLFSPQNFLKAVMQDQDTFEAAMIGYMSPPQALSYYHPEAAAVSTQSETLLALQQP